MDICKIVGNVVSTNKTEKLLGMKLLVAQVLNPENMEPTGKFSVITDTVGAGFGEIVLVVSGSSARMSNTTKDKPVDAVAVGIVDTIEYLNMQVYNKSL